MLKINYDKKTYLLPENFNELSGDQLVRICALMKSEEDHSLRVLHILLNKSLFSPWFLVPLDAKHRLLQYCDWVFGENTLTAQLLPKYKGFYAPKGEFDNLTLGEFHFTELFYRQYIQHDELALNRLIAVLYRKPKKFYNARRDSEGDIRVPFNANEIDYFARKINRWPYAVKTAIVTWYDGCREHMVQLYDKVFSTAQADEAMQDELGMYNVIRNLSGVKFGTIKEVEKIFVHHAFLEIEKTIEENEEAEKQIKAASK